MGKLSEKEKLRRSRKRKEKRLENKIMRLKLRQEKMDSGLDNENPPELGGEEVFFQDDEGVVEEQILDGEIEDGEAPEDPEDEIKLEHPPIKQEPPIQSVFKNQLDDSLTKVHEEDMEIETDNKTESPDDRDLSPSRRFSPRRSPDRQKLFDEGFHRGESYEKWKMSARLMIPAKTAGSIIGKQGSTIKALRDQFGCSVIIPDSRGPERIITIRAANFDTIGQIIARCADHLDEFLRRNIPLRLMVVESTLQKLSHDLEDFCLQNFGAHVRIMNINCPYSRERIIEVGGDSIPKGEACGYILNIVGQDSMEAGESVYYDPNKFEPDSDYGGFNRLFREEKHDFEHQHHFNPMMEDEMMPHQRPIKEQLWLRKFIVPAKYFIYIVGRGGSRLEEIKRGSGARVRYGPLQNDERLLVISGTHDQIDMAIYLIQNVIKRHLD